MDESLVDVLCPSVLIRMCKQNKSTFIESFEKQIQEWIS